MLSAGWGLFYNFIQNFLSDQKFSLSGNFAKTRDLLAILLILLSEKEAANLPPLKLFWFLLTFPYIKCPLPIPKGILLPLP
jgi:hypothetical protein